MLESNPNRKDVQVKNPDQMSMRDAGDLLRIHEVAMYRLCREGKLPAEKRGGRWVLLRSRFDSWMDSCMARTLGVDSLSLAGIGVAA